ncbi:MAG: sulfurtransferase [Acidiferrobacterales bacterium]
MSFTTLVDTQTLAAHLDDPQWVIFDCRFNLNDVAAGQRTYVQGHIPNARYAHLDEDLSSPITPTSGRHPLPDLEVLARKLGQWGVDEHKQVVVYDNMGGAIATRLWWLLRWFGHKTVALLDGGLPKWQREGRPVNTEEPKITPTVFQSRRDDSLWVNTGFVEEVAEHGGYLLIDTRDVERFRGEVEPLDKVAGHIPGSANRPLQSNLDRSGCLLPPMDLRQQFIAELKGVGPERVIATCGSGVTACHNILAMEHAGLPGAKLYAGSWSEWIRDSKRPVATG